MINIMSSATKVCSLCSEMICNNNFEVMDECRTSMLELISGDLDIVITCNQLICLDCSRNLQQSFEFKSACLNNEDYLKTFIHSSGEAKLCLEDIIFRQTVILDGVKCEEEKVCRFCLHYRDVTLFTKLNDVDEDIFLKDMLKKCLPEIDLKVTNNPLICLECMESLQNQFNFVINCFDSCERLLKIDLSLRTSNVMNVKEVNEISRVNSKYAEMETENGVMSDGIVIKQENDFEVIEEFDFQVNIDEYVKLEEDDAEFEGCSQSKNQGKRNPVFKDGKTRYSCTKCSHQTNRKDSLKRHYLTHEKSTSCQKFKCEHCDYTTNWKASLSQHYFRHYSPADMPTFQCAHCPYKAKYKKHLMRHTKRHMSMVKRRYNCEYCPFKTDDGWYFKQHNRNRHKKEVTLEKESFKCRKCIFESTYKAEYDEHVKIKHNIFRYVCDCGYNTQRLSHFKDHQLTHKSENEVTMYSCDKCDFQTKHRKSCKTHIRLHELRKK